MNFEAECVMAVQGHSRLLILAPIERAYATTSLTATLVLSCTTSDIRRLIGRKTQIFPHHSHLTHSLGFLYEPYSANIRVLGLSVGEEFVILACVVLTQRQRDCHRADGQMNTSTVANTGL